jgi:tetratricopeptide (TPR) repeat protein
MRAWLDDLYEEASQAREKNQLTLELQELILKRAGESISKILELEKRANLASRKVSDEFTEAFEKNEAVLHFVIQSNETVIEELQEEKMDKVADTQAFLDSPEWQLPHRLISLSRYWMSWNRYYRSFLYPEGDAEARSLLRDAIGGFSLTLFDIEDQAIVAKSLFGRALCFKEEKRYDKAVADLDSITKHVRHNDPLYMWSLYEQALIAYRLGKYDTALAHLDKLDTGIEAKTLSDVLGSEHKRLRERVVLEPRVKALLEKLDKEEDKTGETAKGLCHQAHRGLKRLSRYDAAHATRLYRLVAEYPAFFSSFSDEGLGAIGNLALADNRFNEGKYEEAVKRYRSLWTSRDMYIRKRMDDIYFRSGYAYCQIGRWKNALTSFDELYAKYPRSKFVGKAVCLEYVAAAGRYKRKAGQSNYSRYIASAKRYLKECPNPRDRNGAHFLLGKDYHKKGRPREARREFTAIAENSPHYWPAMYYVMKEDVETLERRQQKGGKRSGGTRKLYQSLATQFTRFQKLASRERPGPGIAEVAPHMTILHARLYRCAPEPSCAKATKTLEGFEKRFPKNRPLWLKAMDLRFACYDERQMIDPAKEQIRYLSQKYPVDESLWDFLGEWAERYDKKAKGLWEAGNRPLGDGYAELSLAIYAEMSGIVLEKARYAEYLDAIQIRMGEMLLALNETERAGQVYEEVLQRTPDSAEALYQLGKIYEGQGQWDAALEVLRKYAKGIEAGSQAWLDSRYRIAVAHSKMGRDSEACEVITMIHVLHPEAGDEALRKKIFELGEAVCEKGGQALGR